MRYAILSDIHSNLEALERALDYLSDQNIDKYWVLGDLVGYGANPQEVCDRLFKLTDVIILGNHDQAIFDAKLLDWFNQDARTALEWTKTQLNQETKDKLAKLPYIRIENDVTLTHSSPNYPEEYSYIFEWKDVEPVFSVFKTRFCFIGHTHVPQLFSEKAQISRYLEEGTCLLDRSERYLINCGSVGQPRDYDKRLSCGILDDKDDVLDIVRLEYDKRKAADKIRSQGLPAFLADRLL
jgi:diadenosine tetraphosphatase ApaH/serine/threonine PP2A family protein phosphatase